MCKPNLLTRIVATLALTMLVMSTGILAQPDCQDPGLKITPWTDQPPEGGTIEIWGPGGPGKQFLECEACCVTFEIYGLAEGYSIRGGFYEYEIFTSACDSEGTPGSRTLVKVEPFLERFSDGVNPIEIEFCSSGFADSDSFELHTDPAFLVYLDGVPQPDFGVGGNLAPDTGWDQTCDILGCTPGYWKNHLDSWCTSFSPEDNYCEALGLVEDLEYLCPDDRLTLKKAVAKKGNRNCAALVRHSAAALLNACSFDPAEPLCVLRFGYAYKYDIATVQGYTASGFAGDCNEFKDMLEHANEQMCALQDPPPWLGTEGAGEVDVCGGWDESCNPYWYPNP